MKIKSSILYIIPTVSVLWALALSSGTNTPYLSTQKIALPFDKPKEHPLYPSWNLPTPTLLKEQILAYKEATGMDAKFGVAIASLHLGRLEVDINADSFFTPASTLKTIVTGSSILAFPPQTAPKTLLHLRGQKKGNVFSGKLILEGMGDPNLSSRFFTETTTPFDPWIDSLKSWGISKLDVHTVAIDTFFSGTHYPAAWHPRHRPTSYGAPISALSYQDNCAYIRIYPGAKAGLPARIELDPPVPYLQINNRVRTTNGRRRSVSILRTPGTNTFTLGGSIGIRHGALEKEVPVYNPPGYALAGLIYTLGQKGIEVQVQSTQCILPNKQLLAQKEIVEATPDTLEIEEEDDSTASVSKIPALSDSTITASQDSILAELDKFDSTSLDSALDTSFVNQITDTPTIKINTPSKPPSIQKLSNDQSPSVKWSKTIPLYTAPLQSIVDEINQRSQNQHAEILLRLLGKKETGIGSDSAGIQAEKKIMAGLGLDTSMYRIYDGSGLSDFNKVTPRGMVSWLGVLAHQPRARTFFSSLVTPGLGVRARRLAPWGQFFRMKTGFVGGTEGLVGYIFNPVWNDTLVFAFYLNGYRGDHHRGSSWIDSLAANVHRWYNPTSETQSMYRVAELLQSPNAPSSFHKRLDYFSEALMGTPYVLGPMGEGRFATIDHKPLVEMNSFDCVTYIEHVLALSLSHTSKDFLPNLNRIRYGQPSIHFANRNHFFVQDWLLNNRKVVAPLILPGEIKALRTTGKKKFFADKGIVITESDPQTPLNYLPSDTAIALAKNWPYSDEILGVGFVGTIDWLWITHTGFVIAKQGQPLILRHASSKNGKVSEDNLAEYLAKRGKSVLGIHLFGWRESR